MSNPCPICHEIPSCPVTLNGSIKIEEGIVEPRLRKCKFSQSNPSCLLCVRDYINYQTNHKKKGFNCFSNCCWIPIRGWETYGEIGREPEDVAEPTLWRALGKNGVVDCRKCNQKCESVYDLALHIKNSCPYRKVMCYICNTLIAGKDFKEHQKVCKIYCCDCNTELVVKTPSMLGQNPLGGFKWIKIHKHSVLIDGEFVTKSQRKPIVVEQHYCEKKELIKCPYCKRAITIENIKSHIICSKSVSDHCYPFHRDSL